MAHICLCSRLCQTAFNSGVGALKTNARLLGRPCGEHPPVIIMLVSVCPFSGASLMVAWRRNSVGLLLTVKQASAMLDSLNGSSVTNNTRSRETRANTRRSVSSRAHTDCNLPRPSTFCKAPPKSLKYTLNLYCMSKTWRKINQSSL